VINIRKTAKADQAKEASAAMSNPESKAYKWWILGCLMMALVALKTYYVREMIAALVIFSALFGIVAFVALGFFALDRVGQRTFACARTSASWLVRRAATSSAAIVEDFRKRRLNNPHSRTVDDPVMAAVEDME
jgi:hypothetical protein